VGEQRKTTQGYFATEDLVAVSDETILADPKKCDDTLRHYAHWLAEGREVKGTQLERIYLKIQARRRDA
jgi:hypothetical protein